MTHDFLQYLATNKNYSANTLRAYQTDLVQFAHWAKENATVARWSRIEKSDIDRYVTYLYEMHKQPATITRHVSSLRSFYSWLQATGRMTKNPAQYVSSPKVAERVPETISRGKITAALDSKAVSLTTKVMIAMMSETGIRVQEMLDLKVSDINTTERSIVIRGKGNKERKVYYGNRTASLLAQFLPAGFTGTLFTQTQREVRSEIWKALQSHPHALRHTFATTMLNQGGSLEAIQWQLGHKASTTTQRYARLGTPTVRQQYIQFAPTF